MNSLFTSDSQHPPRSRHAVHLGECVCVCVCGVFTSSRLPVLTQVNRMSRSRRVLAIGGKQRINWLDMVCIETILFHLESF